jgi:hypothetical protein
VSALRMKTDRALTTIIVLVLVECLTVLKTSGYEVGV